MNKITSALKRGFAALMPTCQDVARLQSVTLDTRLGMLKRLGLCVHLLMCKWCRRYGKQIRFLHHAASEHPDNLVEAIPQSLSPEARERIKERLRGEK